MAVRVNRRRSTRADYAARLEGHGVRSRPGIAPDSLVIDPPRPVATLPGFGDGLVTVQDEGAQLAVDVLGPKTGERVLDACAAPGGKATACLERAQVDLVALDVDPERCGTIRRELARLGFDPDCARAGDATALDWWDGRSFQRVLVDAPCSGTGTLRRHPDIKLLRRESDLGPYHAIQSRLLTNLWQVLAPGGVLVYCTCSILDDENDLVVAEFLASRADARPRAITAGWGTPTRCGRILLPSDGGPDTFYYAAIEKAD
jgi:16S rRNA (cytosine967-C5)-methyltransferase